MSTSWGKADATAALTPPGLAGCCSPSLSNTTSLIINDFLAGYFMGFYGYSQSSATSDTTTGLLMSEEGPLVLSMVASTEGFGWGMVAAG